MLRAIVFDFDGTILDTEIPAFRSWQDTFGRHGASLPLAEWARVVGTAGEAFNPVDYLERQIGIAVDREAEVAWRRRRHRELIGRETLRPGVLDVLRDARRAGVKLGIASSSPRAWVVEHLTRLDVRDFFTAICTSDDVIRVKPEPDLFRLTVEQLGVRPDEALAIEDSPNGALAATRAALRCLVVPNDVTRHLKFPAVDARLDSLAGVNLEALFAGMTAGG